MCWTSSATRPPPRRASAPARQVARCHGMRIKAVRAPPQLALGDHSRLDVLRRHRANETRAAARYPGVVKSSDPAAIDAARYARAGSRTPLDAAALLGNTRVRSRRPRIGRD